MDISNSTKGGPFGSAGGRIPEGGTQKEAPLNPLVAVCRIAFKLNLIFDEVF